MRTDFIATREPVANQKYDVVILIGPDIKNRDEIESSLRNSGLSYCIIGDGSIGSFVSQANLDTLKNKIGEETNIFLVGHGNTTRFAKGAYQQHHIALYGENSQPTINLSIAMPYQ